MSDEQMRAAWAEQYGIDLYVDDDFVAGWEAALEARKAFDPGTLEEAVAVIDQIGDLTREHYLQTKAPHEVLADIRSVLVASGVFDYDRPDPEDAVEAAILARNADHDEEAGTVPEPPMFAGTTAALDALTIRPEATS